MCDYDASKFMHGCFRLHTVRKTTWDEKEAVGVKTRASTSPYSCCMDVDSAVVIEGGGPASDHGGDEKEK